MIPHWSDFDLLEHFLFLFHLKISFGYESNCKWWWGRLKRTVYFPISFWVSCYVSEIMVMIRGPWNAIGDRTSRNITNLMNSFILFSSLNRSSVSWCIENFWKSFFLSFPVTYSGIIRPAYQTSISNARWSQWRFSFPFWYSWSYLHSWYFA